MEDSADENSITDDHKITMLRQIKKSVDTIGKYNEIHPKNNDELSVVR